MDPKHLPDTPILTSEQKQLPLFGVTPLPAVPLKTLAETAQRLALLHCSGKAFLQAACFYLRKVTSQYLKQQMNPQCLATENRFYFIAGGTNPKENYFPSIPTTISLPPTCPPGTLILRK